MEMGVFSRATCAAIDNGDFRELAAHLAFIDELFRNAPPDLENAIYVSYLEDVFLAHGDERYRSARSALSGRLRAALGDLEGHWKKITEWSQKQSSER